MFKRASNARRLAYIQACQHTLCPGQIPNEPAYGKRQGLDQRGHGHDLILGRYLGLLVEVNYLQVVAPLQVFLADGLDLAGGPSRLGRGPCPSRCSLQMALISLVALRDWGVAPVT